MTQKYICVMLTNLFEEWIFLYPSVKLHSPNISNNSFRKVLNGGKVYKFLICDGPRFRFLLF